MRQVMTGRETPGRRPRPRRSGPPAVGRAVRGLGSATVLLVLLVGPPLVLATTIGNPLPRSSPSPFRNRSKEC